MLEQAHQVEVRAERRGRRKPWHHDALVDNTHPRPPASESPVGSGTMSRMWVARATALCLAVHGAAGCTDVGGGAVELSWKLRPASSPLEEKFVACDPGEPGTRPVVAIQLDWEVRDQAGSALWPCTDNNGVTGFDLPARSEEHTSELQSQSNLVC